MKKIIALLLCPMLLFALVGCGESSTQVANPISEITSDDMASELGLKEIKLGDVKNVSKINGSDVLYDIDITKEGKDYNIRLAKGIEREDISGVYLSGDIKSTSFESAEETIPSVTVESDGEYTKAYGNWNGFSFSVSVNEVISTEEMKQATVDFMQALIAKENIK